MCCVSTELFHTVDVEAKRRTKKLLLYELEEAFEIDLCHEFQLYTFARSSSDNFSPTRKSNTCVAARLLRDIESVLKKNHPLADFFFLECYTE